MTMYPLLLTSEDRRAFDWVGDRYNAAQVAAILMDHLPEDREWADESDITFEVLEHAAWEIQRLAEEENLEWPRFAADLRTKLNDFLGQIV
jgi:hypothetical protein